MDIIDSIDNIQPFSFMSSKKCTELFKLLNGKLKALLCFNSKWYYVTQMRNMLNYIDLKRRFK